MQVGDVVDGKYELIRILGEGGMGSVYEARHIRLGLRVALKFLRAELAQSPVASERFLREAQAAAAIGSDHIVRVSDVGETPETGPFIVMEHLEGESLSHLLAREGRLDVGRAVRLVTQVCRALGAAHERGIVHRDLKPDNLILARGDDGADRIKVLDFGIAKVRETLAGAAPQLTATGSTLGTPFYMAPEQAWGAKDIDHRADQYAAAVVLYELLTGRRPFKADSVNELIIRVATTEPEPPRAHRPDLPEALEAVLLRAMAKDREERFPSMAALAEALLPWAEALEAPEAPETPPVPRPEEVLGAAPTMAAEPLAASRAAAPPEGGDIGTDATLASDGAAGAPVAGAWAAGPAVEAEPVPAASVRATETDGGLPSGEGVTPATAPATGSAPPRGRRLLWPWLLVGGGLLATCAVGTPLCLCTSVFQGGVDTVPGSLEPAPMALGSPDGSAGALELISRHGDSRIAKAVVPDGSPAEGVALEAPSGETVVTSDRGGEVRGNVPGRGPHSSPPSAARAPEAVAAPAVTPRPSRPAAPPSPSSPPRPSPSARDRAAFVEARSCLVQGRYQCCIARLRGGAGGDVGQRMLFDCLMGAGRRPAACRLARRRPAVIGPERLARCR